MSKGNRAVARAVADVSAGRILASIDVMAPPERVFLAITSEEIAKWWGAPDLYRTERWTGDLRVGGAWRCEGTGADGRAFHVEGRFLEIDRPRKVVQTWKAPWDGDHETTLAYLLEPIEGGTRVTVRHEGFEGRAESCAGHANGWERVLGWLNGYLSEPPRWFVLRLLGPRETFPADITTEEARLMKEHAAHCRKRLAEGGAVVFGPVAEGKGAWGLGVVCARNADDVAEFTKGDPVVAAGIGFRYEVLPMLSAIV